MVNLVPAKCPSCGASLELDDNLKRTECKYCKTTIIVDDAIAKYKLEISGNVKVNGIQDDDEKLEIVNNYLKLGEIGAARDLMNEALAKNPFNFKILNAYIKSYNFDKISDDITVQNIHEKIKQLNIRWGEHGYLFEDGLSTKLNNIKVSENKDDKKLYDMVSKKFENLKKANDEYCNIKDKTKDKVEKYVFNKKINFKRLEKILTSLEIKDEDIKEVIKHYKKYPSSFGLFIYPEYIKLGYVECKTSKNIVEIKQIIDNVIDNDKGIFGKLFK